DELQQQMGAMVTTRERKFVNRTLQRARTRDRLQAFAKLTVVDHGELRFKSDPPLLVRLSELVGGDDPEVLGRAIMATFHDYARSLSSDRRMLLDQYRIVDVARKVVGVGSVGTRCWVALLLGRDTNDPLLLQLKEAERSVLEPYTAPSVYQQRGHRVVAG